MQLMRKSSCSSCRRAHVAHAEELVQESSCSSCGSCGRAHAAHAEELMQLMQKSSALTKEVSSAR